MEKNAQAAKILVVDDDTTTGNAIMGHLRGAGYQCALVTSAATATQALITSRPDLMILDLGLPDGDGGELLTRLREHDSIPIIVVSGRDSEESRVAGLDSGADDYITKPFSARELTSRVTSVLRRARLAPTDVVMRFGSIVVDVARHEVRKDDEIVPLTAKEFALLTCLANRPRTVFSRQDLLREVWRGSKDSSNEATVTEHMRRLRLKLEDDPANPVHLCAVRGVGYRLTP